jgi:hypothetical protein
MKLEESPSLKNYESLMIKLIKKYLMIALKQLF